MCAPRRFLEAVVFTKVMSEQAAMVYGGMIRPHVSKLQALARMIDGASLFATLWLVLLLYGVPWTPAYDRMAVTALLAFTFFAEYNEIYYNWRGASMRKDAMRVIVTWFFVLVVLVLVGYFAKISEQYSRRVVGAWVLAAPLVTILLHGFYRSLLGYVRRRGRNSRKVAIVGANRLGRRVAQAIAESPWLGYRVLGVFDESKDNEQEKDDGPTPLRELDTLYQEARSGGIDVVFIALPMREELRIQALLRRLADTTASVYVVPDLFVFDLLHSRWWMVQGLPVVSVYETPFKSAEGLAKRMADIVFSSLVIAVVALPMLIIASVIRCSSPGPVIFKQRRYGVHGEPINVWKFRTMSVCEDGGDVPQARRNDPRITCFGAFLRRTSLDELPQFFNVVQGTMSVVGPRPHAVAHNEYYRGRIQGYMLRHKVKPGITGLAQVRGFRGETDTLDKMEGRIRQDLEYIANWSPLLDIKIVLLTIVKGFVGRRAY